MALQGLPFGSPLAEKGSPVTDKSKERDALRELVERLDVVRRNLEYSNSVKAHLGCKESARVLGVLITRAYEVLAQGEKKPTIRCSRCGGSGKGPAVYPGTGAYRPPCRACNGKGRTPKKKARAGLVEPQSWEEFANELESQADAAEAKCKKLEIELAKALAALPEHPTGEPVEETPQSQCPKCGKWVDDLDGFGVLAHTKPAYADGCGYCSHPSRDGGVCGICGDVEQPTGEPRGEEGLTEEKMLAEFDSTMEGAKGNMKALDEKLAGEPSNAVETEEEAALHRVSLFVLAQKRREERDRWKARAEKAGRRVEFWEKSAGEWKSAYEMRKLSCEKAEGMWEKLRVVLKADVIAQQIPGADSFVDGIRHARARMYDIAGHAKTERGK